ncbi:hypothetical protein COCOBI_19-1360 [Coccomyxa sp. Obi]|nr:hypothetical protein COCOBI_19-1360 [Coccomyxa sp. Obi]
MLSGHSDELEVLWGPDHNQADREWRGGASDPEQCGTPKSSQDTDSQICHAQHHLNGVPAIPSLFQKTCIGQAPTARLQETAAASLARGSDDGSAQDGNQMNRAEVSARAGPPRRRGGKRPLPAPDLAAIEDPAEMRLQKRLLKNRRTAAASRDRKRKEMERLGARVKGLQMENEELRDALEQRNAEILTLSMDMLAKQPQAAAALKLSPPPAAHLASALRGDLPRHRRSSAWAGQPRHVPGSPGSLRLPTAQPWPELGQPQSSDCAARNAAARSFSLPDGEPAAAAPQRPTAVGCAEAPPLGQPLSMRPRGSVCMKSLSLPSGNFSSAEVNLPWSRGLSAEAESGFFRSVNCQSHSSAFFPTQPLPVGDLPMSRAVGQLDGQLLQGRAFSCPIPGGPAVEPVGGTCPSGQLLELRSGSYPLHRRQMPAHVNSQPLHVTLGFPDLLSPADPTGLDQMDFGDFWHGFD